MHHPTTPNPDNHQPEPGTPAAPSPRQAPQEGYPGPWTGQQEPSHAPHTQQPQQPVQYVPGPWDPPAAAQFPVDDPGQVPPLGPPSGKKRFDFRKHRRALIIGGSVLAALLTVGGTMVAVNTVTGSGGDDGAAAVVTTYLQALKDEDTAKALSVADPGVPDDEKVLLKGDIYKSAGKHIDGFKIVASNPRSGFVEADIQQQDRTKTQEFILSKSSDGNWKIGPSSFQKINIGTDHPADTITVNGTDVKAPEGTSFARSGNRALPAFPGEYTIGLPATNKYATAEAQKALVSVDPYTSTGVVTVKVIASKALLQETDKQLVAKWTSCAETSTSRDATDLSCPAALSLYTFDPTRNVKWTFTKKPTYTLTAQNDGTWYIGPGDPGTATVTYEKNNGPDWVSKTENVTFNAGGIVQTTNDTVTVKFGS